MDAPALAPGSRPSEIQAWHVIGIDLTTGAIVLSMPSRLQVTTSARQVTGSVPASGSGRPAG